MILQGKGLSNGSAEGRLLLSGLPFSFARSVDPDTGLVVDEGSDLNGQSVAGRILAIPGNAGSTGESSSISILKERGFSPAGMVAQHCDHDLVNGAVASRIPLVDGIDIELLRMDDDVTVDGGEGTVDLKEITAIPVVTSFLKNKTKILIMKRSDKVRTAKGKWAGVSGYVEKGEIPDETAVKEIREETGIENPALIRKGGSIFVRGGDDIFQIHIFLFEVDTDVVTIDWEHTGYRWILPDELNEYDTVSRLAIALGRVLGNGSD
jgi:predicted aconitase with swiveling domain